MSLESATFIDDLVTTNPVVGDNVSQGDDHLRLIKAALKATFPGQTRATYIEQDRVDLASATTPDLSTPASQYINITGTTQIDGFATEPAGFTRLLRFAGILTLNYNGTSMILLSGDDIVTAADDHAVFESRGAGNWRMISYFRRSGKALVETDQIVTIASTDVGKALTATDDSPKATAWEFTPPVGVICAWPAASVPSRWLECDGSSLLRASFPDLFAVIGVTYGAADGTHFTLPDYRGEFLRGMDPGATRDPDSASRTDRGDGTAGANVGTKQGHQFTSHTHAVAATVLQIDNDFGGAAGGYTKNDLSTGANSGSAGGNETRPRNVNVKWIIRAT